MRHIALVSSSFPFTAEGNADGREAAGSFVADFAQALSRHVKVSVVAPSALTQQHVIHNTLVLNHFAVPHLPLSLLKPNKPSMWLPIFQTLRAGQQALEQLLARENIDHIFALWALPSGHWARQAAQRHHIPYSTWALGSDIWSLGKIPVVKNWLQRVLCDSQHNFADGYILKDDVEHLSQRTCTFLPSTRQLELPGLPPLKVQPPYTLAFLGRWHPNKGIDLLLESLKLLPDSVWQQIKRVHIAGGGPLENQVHEQCAVLKTQGRPLVLQGYLDKTAATDWFINADYVLIPSRIESIPVVFSDAMKCQCPIVAMPVGDLPRLVKKYQIGSVATQVSATAFATAIQQALTQAPQQFANGLTQAESVFNVTHSVNAWLDKISAA